MIKATKRNILSTPKLYYLLIFCIAVLFLILSLILQKKCSILKDLGIGIFCSTIVAFVVDIGATRRKNKQEDIVFRRIVSDLKESCDYLLAIVVDAYYDAFGLQVNAKHSFSEWVNLLFQKTEPNYAYLQKEQINYFLCNIVDIRKKAIILNNDLGSLYNNWNVSEDFEKALKNLIRVSNSIENDRVQGKYENCKRWIIDEKWDSQKTIKYRNLIDIIILLFPDLKSKYEQKYNEEDYGI